MGALPAMQGNGTTCSDKFSRRTLSGGRHDGNPPNAPSAQLAFNNEILREVQSPALGMIRIVFGGCYAEPHDSKASFEKGRSKGRPSTKIGTVIS